MFEGLISQKAEHKIRDIIKKTAEENNLNPTEIQFALRLNNYEKVEIIPYYNKQSHEIMSVKDFFKD